MTHKIRLAKLSDFRPQATNANQHTERGMALLESSMRQDGFFDGMTATADGEIIDGSARIEKSAVVFDEDVIVLEHDGTKPIVEVRTNGAKMSGNRNLAWLRQCRPTTLGRYDIQGAATPMIDPGTYESFCLMLAFLFLRPGEEREQFLAAVTSP